MVKIAAVQTDIALAQPAHNRRHLGSELMRAAAQGAQLIVFPECSVTGYGFESILEARQVAETIPGPSTEYFAQLCREHECYAVFGTVEQDGANVFNSAVLVGPGGLVGRYRKTHLPYLGIDRYATAGADPYRVWETPLGRIGMLICYDLSFPEPSRVLALAGADLIVLPTNWPPGAECAAACTVAARAMENRVFVVAANRIGYERGFPFIGRSRICDIDGQTLAAADDADARLLLADCELSAARDKRIVRVQNQHEIDRLADRRPDLYGPLLDPVQGITPRARHTPDGGVNPT